MEKQRWEESRRRRKEVRRSEKRKSEKKEDAGARKGREVAIHCVFPMIWGSGGSKSNLAKAAGAEPAGQMRDEQLHAVVARSTCPNQNVQNTSASQYFLKLRCRKSVRRCGTKHISKSKVSKTVGLGPLFQVELSKKCTRLRRLVKSAKTKGFGPLLEVQMSKMCTPLWPEARFQVKMYKTRQLRTTFESCNVQKVHAVVARNTFPSQKCKKMWGLDRFWTVRCRFAWHAQGILHLVKSEQNVKFLIILAVSTTTTNKLHYTTLHYTTLH